MRRFAPLSAWLCLAALASGCAQLSHAPKVDIPEAATLRQEAMQAEAPPRSAPASGSLFDAARYRPAFEVIRARQIGDIITVSITENVSARQSSSSSIDRSGSVSSSVSGLPLIGNRLNARLSAGADSANQFAGEGETSSTHTFSGTITTTVIAIRPNGNLLVLGEKQVGLNENVDVLRFSGTVDPRTIRPGNVVASTELADVRIVSRNRGAQGEALSMGWLARFFLSVLPF